KTAVRCATVSSRSRAAMTTWRRRMPRTSTVACPQSRLVGPVVSSLSCHARAYRREPREHGRGAPSPACRVGDRAAGRPGASCGALPAAPRPARCPDRRQCELVHVPEPAAGDAGAPPAAVTALSGADAASLEPLHGARAQVVLVAGGCRLRADLAADAG